MFEAPFSFSRVHRRSDQPTTSNRVTDTEKATIICRVLIGRCYTEDSNFETCPEGFDTVRNGSDIYIVYSNEQILPLYLVTYKD